MEPDLERTMPRFPRSLSVSLAALCLGAWGAAAQEIEEAEEDPVAIILPEISITAGPVTSGP